MMANVKDIQSAYAAVLKALTIAEGEISRRLASAIAQLGDPHLVRGRVDAARVKSLASVAAKCEKKGLASDSILALTDLVGVRVVCANLEDVSRLIALV